MNRKLLLVGILASFISLAGCDGDSNETPETPSSTLEFASTSLSFNYGEKGTVLVLNVTPEDRVSDVEFSVADSTVAEIVSTELLPGHIDFVLDGVGIGETSLVAVLDDVLVTCDINVGSVQVESLELDRRELALDVNKSEVLSVTVQPSSATNPVIRWSSSDEDVAVVSRGLVTGLSEGTAVITAECGNARAECHVTVNVIRAGSITFDVTDKEMTENETFIITAEVLPENISYMNVKWAVDNPDIVSLDIIDAVEGDNIVAAKVSAKKAGQAEISASADGVKAVCNVVVNPEEEPVAPPKIGDYYYSDGTWSDGGLLSINSDGTNPVWAAEKPYPVEDKTVIGIVFQTDPERFSSEDKADGFTHGLVICTKGAHGPDSKLTRYSFEYSFETVPVCRLGTSWYADVNGRRWTNCILDEFAGNLQKCPAFDWVTTDFSPAAPSNTSDWYVPSAGQLWDVIANLGGNDAAEYLKILRGYSSDITYYSSYYGDKVLGYNMIDAINSAWALVPDSQKEDLFTTRDRNGSGVAELMASTLYDNSDGVCCLFWLGDNGLLEPTCGWVDDPVICHPVLAF
ncbi:MAG: Ig domain-containing protein [Candidatus Cryptobacteroides sp.]